MALGKINLGGIMSRKLLLLALVGLSFSAQAQNSCYDALDMVQRLALNGRYDSVISDVDRLKDVSRSITDGLDGLDRIYDSTRNLNQIQIANSIENTSSAVKENVQQAFNNNYNAQRILEGGLQKYEQAMRNAGLDDAVNHMKSALQTAAASESYIRNALAGFDRIKQTAQNLDTQVASTSNRISGSLRDQRASLQRGTQAASDMAYNLVGSRYYWGSYDPEPRSKLGNLKSASEYLSRNSCIR